MFFGYSIICESIAQYISIPYLKTSYLWAILLIGSSYLIWIISSNEIVRKITKVVIVVAFTTSLFELSINNIRFIYNERGSSIALIPNQDNLISKDVDYVFKHTPNIYFILTDAYARHDTLQESANFDNTDFLKQLKKKGFTIGKNTFSNYHFTVASLSATMNMKLHSHDDKSPNLIQYNPQMHESLKGNNIVRKIFKKNKYKIINIPAQWHQMGCHGFEDKCVQQKSSEISRSFLSSTPLKIFDKYFFDDYVTVEDIKYACELFPNEPKFVFAHLAHVHDAIYDESGRFKSVMHPIYSSPQDAHRYICSIKKLNTYLLEVVDFLRKNDPNAIIIIQADHGPTYIGNQKVKNVNYFLENFDAFNINNSDDFKFTFGIFSAIYLPNLSPQYEEVKGYLSDSLTPVNLFKSLFSYISERKPELENDCSYLFKYDKNAQANRSVEDNHFKK